MATFAFTLLPLVPLAVWVMLIGWSPMATEGELLLTVSIPVLTRAKMFTVPFVTGLAMLLIFAVIGEVTWTSAWLLLVTFAVLLAIPSSYRLTTVGIRTGRGPFRRWTEFAGVRRSASGATLQGGPRASSYPIFLSGNRDDDDFVLTLKGLVRDSYQGRATERDRIRGDGQHSQSGGDTGTTSSMSH